jgi:hypothetical protein
MRPLLSLLLAPLALAACSPSAQPPATPEPSLTLSAPVVASAATSVGAAPVLALAPDGRRATAWVSAPGGGDDGRLYVSVDGGAPVELRDALGPIEAHGEAPPKLAFGPDGALHALYVVGKVVPGRRFPLGALRLVSSTDGGRRWSAPLSVTDAAVFGAYNFHALYAAPDGALYAAWLDGRDGKSATYVTRSVDGGRTWAANRRVSPGESCPCCRTAIATAPDGALYVAWRAVLPGGVRDVVVARSADGGATWGAPVRVHADDWVFDACPHAGPSMQVDSAGAVHVAWWTGKEGAAGVFYARSADGARSFAAPVALGVARHSRPAHVQLALAPGGIVAAAWDDGTLRVPQVKLRVSRDGGASFAAALPVSEAGRAATFPVLAAAGRRVTVAWTEQSEDAAARARTTRPTCATQGEHALPRVGEGTVVTRTGEVR